MGQRTGISADVSSLFSRLGLGGIESYRHFSPRSLRGEAAARPVHEGAARQPVDVDQRPGPMALADDALPDSEAVRVSAAAPAARPEPQLAQGDAPQASAYLDADVDGHDALTLSRVDTLASSPPETETLPASPREDDLHRNFTSSTLPPASLMDEAGLLTSLTPQPGASFELPGLGRVNLDFRPSQAVERAVPERTPRVVFHSIQGGAGVSTLATGLAAQLAQAGWAPRILDLKGTAEASLFFPQARRVSGADALVLGREGGPHAVGLLCPSALDIPGHGVWPVSLIERCEPQCRELFSGLAGQAFMICDLPSGHHELWRRSLADADLNVIPLRPDAFALRAAEAMLRVLEGEPGKALFVLNTFDPDDLVHRQVEASLRELLGPQLASLPVLRDAGLAASMLKGEPFAAELFRGAGFQALYAHCALAALQRLHQA